MRLVLAIAVARPGMIERCLDLVSRHAADRGKVDVLLFGNGLSVDRLRAILTAAVPGAMDGWHRFEIESSEKNEGVPVALHRLWLMAKRNAETDGVSPHDDIIAYIHDDAFILGTAWDAESLGPFRDDPLCALAGYSGAVGLGLDGLYQRPYDITNLVRIGFVSNLVQAEHHGRRGAARERVVVTDGYSMILRRSLLDQIGGWMWWPFVHHNYDVAIACQVARAGMRAYYVPVASDHLSGFTANNDEGKALLVERGGEIAIHHESARYLYDHFRDVLPLRIR